MDGMSLVKLLRERATRTGTDEANRTAWLFGAAADRIEYSERRIERLNKTLGELQAMLGCAQGIILLSLDP